MGFVGDLCRKLSGLKADEINQLERMTGLFPLVADVAYGKASLYVPGKVEGQYLLVIEAFPHTSYFEKAPEAVGKLFQKNEEPLVDLTFKIGESQLGKRQWSVTEKETDLQSWPIRLDSSEGVVGVLIFEWSIPENSKIRSKILAETAFELFVGSLQVGKELLEPVLPQDGMMLFQGEGKILWTNEAAEQLYRPCGVGHLVGRWYYERILNLKGFSRTLGTLKPICMPEKMGDNIWECRYIPVLRGNQLLKVLVIISDKTEVLEKEKEIKIKEVLIREMHHRVKNNLQTIAGLLRMQARRSSSDEVKEALQEGIQRIFSMAIVHEFLAYKVDEEIRLSELVANLFQMNQNIASEKGQLGRILPGDEVFLSPDEASNLALVLNELIQNALDHGQAGSLEIFWQVLDNGVEIAVQNTVAMDGREEPKSEESLGFQIVRTLTKESLQGSFSFERDGEVVKGKISFGRGEG